MRPAAQGGWLSTEDRYADQSTEELMTTCAGTLLRVRDLAVDFKVPQRGSMFPARLRAVSGVDLDIRRGEILGVVGESGCGKSTTGRAILQLLEPATGTVTFDGTELTHWPAAGCGRCAAGCR